MNQIIYPTILHEGTPLHLVPHFPDNGYRFYVARDGRINGEMCGIRIAPNGRTTLIKATTDTTVNCKNRHNANRKQRYGKFMHPWNTEEHLLVSRAVFLAWSGERIPLYHQIHHLNGITVDNCVENLLCVDIHEHYRISDVRQKALRTVVPDGDLTLIPYERLCQLQDPRVLTDEQFQSELDYMKEELKKHPLVHVDPLAAAAEEPARDFDIFVERD